MADDANLSDDISKFDPENLRQDILQLPLQAEQGYKLVEALDLNAVKGTYSSVIISGMGGSAIAGLVLQSYLADDSIKLFVNQDYILPKWADKSTLVIVSSYSGNTEEAISVFKEARRKECGLIVVSIGGKLEEYAKIPRLPVVILPSGYPPRTAMGIMFFAMLRLLERLRLVESKAREVLRIREELKGQLPMLERNAIALSEKFVNRIPLIYTSTRFKPIGYRWKCDFNENSKRLAFNNVFSEMNHNEGEAFENIIGNFHAIILRFEEDNRRIQQRMNLTKDIILKKGVPVTDIGVRGPSMLSKIFSAIMLGDLTSYYLAIRLKTNPNRYNFIEDFKKSLGPYVG
ncbi:MAG: bifunctional phosphoglucose/phosphomannose isomerase [archaeon]